VLYFLVLLQNSWLRVKITANISDQLYPEKHLGWLDSLTQLEIFYTGQLRQSRQPLGMPHGGLDCLIVRFGYELTGQRSLHIFGNQVAID
jgi:hypothetical protein